MGGGQHSEFQHSRRPILTASSCTAGRYPVTAHAGECSASRKGICGTARANSRSPALAMYS
eukprot:scaffold10723_cov113-Isochrysis_galbana.AAC.5